MHYLDIYISVEGECRTLQHQEGQHGHAIIINNLIGFVISRGKGQTAASAPCRSHHMIKSLSIKTGAWKLPDQCEYRILNNVETCLQQGWEFLPLPAYACHGPCRDQMPEYSCFIAASLFCLLGFTEYGNSTICNTQTVAGDP